MERKIGEIFEYNREWYQCIVGNDCENCAFNERKCYTVVDNGDPIGDCCADRRKDNKDVIFKKLEKVGRQVRLNGKEAQLIKAVIPCCISCAFFDGSYCEFLKNGITPGCEEGVYIEIKQNQEDMEEKGQCGDNRFEIIAKAKEALLKETNIARDEQEMAVIDNILFRCWQMGWLDKYDDTKHSNSERIGKNLKEFDLEAAKSGKPVCTRDGKKARILCYDLKGTKYPIVAAVETRDRFAESIFGYDKNGRFDHDTENNNDLMMLPEKKEGWVNVYREESNNNERLIEQTIYKTRKDAFDNACPKGYITTTKINWEE